MLVRRLATVGLVLGSMALVAGCATEVQDEGVGASESAIIDDCDPTTQTYPRLCTGATPAKQRNVSASLAFVMGGPTPPACGGTILHQRLTRARDLVNQGKCNLVPLTPTPRCGLSSAIYDLRCYNVNSGDKTHLINIGPDMDTCWGAGSGGLWALQTVVTRCKPVGQPAAFDVEAEIDPEPARVPSGLNGGNLTTAAATYVNTGQGTTAVRWPTGWTLNNTLVGGTSCSPVNVSPNTVLYTSIQASGNYRRCL